MPQAGLDVFTNCPCWMSRLTQKCRRACMVTPPRPARWTAGRQTRSENAVRRMGSPISVVKGSLSARQAARCAASASTTTSGSGTIGTEAVVSGRVRQSAAEELDPVDAPSEGLPLAQARASGQCDEDRY